MRKQHFGKRQSVDRVTQLITRNQHFRLQYLMDGRRWIPRIATRLEISFPDTNNGLLLAMTTFYYVRCGTMWNACCERCDFFEITDVRGRCGQRYWLAGVPLWDERDLNQTPIEATVVVGNPELPLGFNGLSEQDPLNAVVVFVNGLDFALSDQLTGYLPKLRVPLGVINGRLSELALASLRGRDVILGDFKRREDRAIFDTMATSIGRYAKSVRSMDWDGPPSVVDWLREEIEEKQYTTRARK